MRTSLTHPLSIGTLELPSGGRIGVTFCPGKKQAQAMTGQWDRSLPEDVATLKAWGATHLVTLIEPHEFTELHVAQLPQFVEEAGIEWHHLPITDRHAPDARFEIPWKEVRPQLLAALARGEGVVVHCKGGLGRAGTVATRLLRAACPELGWEEAMAKVRAARPGAVENALQEQHLASCVP